MNLAIIDYNRTLYNPDTDVLNEGAEELLLALKGKGFKLVLVSRREGDRKDQLKQFGIADLFDGIHFVEQKSEALFREIIVSQEASQAYVLGDHLHQEIRSGNLAGATTIRFKKGKFADLEPEQETDVPDFTVENLIDALQYIR